MVQPLRRSLWIPWLFAAGLGVVVAVNGVLIWFATGSATGVVVERRERDGAYRMAAAQAERQAALGWRVGIAWRDGDVEVLARDGSGEPLAGFAVDALFVRPVEGTALSVPALREMAPGRYGGAASLPLRGQWDVTVTAARGSDRFAATARIVVP